jgi:hypothetical protein
LSFVGGFVYPESGYEEAWTFEVSGLTGVGELTVVQEVEERGEIGKSLDEYTCASLSQKFYIDSALSTILSPLDRPETIRRDTKP